MFGKTRFSSLVEGHFSVKYKLDKDRLSGRPVYTSLKSLMTHLLGGSAFFNLLNAFLCFRFGVGPRAIICAAILGKVQLVNV